MGKLIFFVEKKREMFHLFSPTKKINFLSDLESFWKIINITLKPFYYSLTNLSSRSGYSLLIIILISTYGWTSLYVLYLLSSLIRFKWNPSCFRVLLIIFREKSNSDRRILFSAWKKVKIFNFHSGQKKSISYRIWIPLENDTFTYLLWRRSTFRHIARYDINLANGNQIHNRRWYYSESPRIAAKNHRTIQSWCIGGLYTERTTWNFFSKIVSAHSYYHQLCAEIIFVKKFLLVLSI